MSVNQHKIAFISAKGGSGKTVISSSIGTFLARLGYGTLLLDADAATNGLSLLFLSRINELKRTNNERLRGVFEIEGEDEHTTAVALEDNLKIVPATFLLSQTENVNPDRFSKALRQAIEEHSENDIVLIDAQAGGDLYAKAAVSIADEVVIVSEFDPISFQGLERLKILFSDVLSPSRTWVLYNKVLPEFAEAIEKGLSIARVLPPIPWEVDVVKAFSQRKLALNLDSPNNYTLAISEICNHLFESAQEKISAWAATTQEIRAQPLLNRLSELDDQITRIERRLINEEYKHKYYRGISFIGSLVILATVGYFVYHAFTDNKSLTVAMSVAVTSASIIATFVVFSQTVFERRSTVNQRVLQRYLSDLLEERREIRISSTFMNPTKSSGGTEPSR